MKSCDEVLDLLPEYMPLVDGEALAVHEHLKVCAECAEAADDLAETLGVLTAHAPAAPALAPDFADRVMTGLAELEPGSAPPAPAGRVVRWPGALRVAAAVAFFAAGAGTAALLGEDPAAPAAGELAAAEPRVASRVDPRPAPASPAPTGRRPLARAPQGGAPAAAPVAYAADPETVDYYVSEASMVLRAVERLGEADPRWLEILALHIRDSGLLDEGERLLLAYEGAPAAPERDGEGDLRPVIHGAQLILRKVHNARESNAPERLWALRREVRETGLIDAMDAVLTSRETPARDPDREERGPL